MEETIFQTIFQILENPVLFLFECRAFRKNRRPFGPYILKNDIRIMFSRRRGIANRRSALVNGK